MKALIRPTLLTLARLGLFVAVVAWVVATVMPGNRLWVWSTRLNGLKYETGFDNTTWLFAARHAFENIDKRSVRLIPGIIYMKSHVQYFLEIRHWLTTSTFLAFNLLLHFIYRKRPEAEPCEA